MQRCLANKQEYLGKLQRHRVYARLHGNSPASLKKMYIHNLESVFIQLGPLTIRYYGILLALAFLTGYFILIKTAKERNIKKELMDDLLLYLIPSILIGARVFHILFYDFSYYSANPLEIFYIWKGGIASHGGLLFGILAVLIYCKKKK